MATETDDFAKINLTLLATVLAHKAGVQVKVGRHFCCTADTMWIPSGMIGTESEAKLIRGGSCHELVGHIRHTNFTIKGSTKLEQSLYNVLEDIRIERAAWTCYPGARSILEEMAVEVDGRGWFDGPPEDELESLLLMSLLRDLRTRRLLQPLDINKTRDTLNRAVQMFGNRWSEVIRLAEQGAGGRSSAEALTAAVEILAIVCKPPPAQQPQPSDQQQASDDSQESDEDGDEGQGGSSAEKEESDAQDGSPDPSKQGDSQEDGDSGNEQDSQKGSGSDDATGDPEDGDSEACDDASDASDSQSAGQSQADDNSGGSASRAQGASNGNGQCESTGQADPAAQATQHVCNPDVSCDVSLDEMLDKFITNEMRPDPYFAEAVEQDLLPNKPLVLSSEQRRIANSLSTQLESALFAWTNDEEEADSDRGRFDSTRITQAYMGDQHSFTRELEDGLDLDTAVYLLVDRSGSTMSIAPAINQALWGIGTALSRYEGSQVEFGVWLFDTHPHPAKRVHTRWLRDKGRCNVESQDSTNWIGSSQPLMRQLALSSKRRKVLFTITDGDLGSADMFDATVGTAKALGLELAFLMIDPPTSMDYRKETLRGVSLSKCYSKDGLQTLQKAIFTALHGSIQPQ